MLLINAKMKSSYKYTFVALILLASLYAKAQDYCVILFSEKKSYLRSPFERALEPLEKDFLWIIPVDSLSISSGEIPIFPFVLDPFDDYHEQGWRAPYWLDMIQHPPIPKNDKWHGRLYGILKGHRRKLQKFSYTQSLGPKQKAYKTTVRVFITPIVGVCNSVVSSYDEQRVFYSKEFEYQPDFFKSDSILTRLKSYPFYRMHYDATLINDHLH
jgi:hypothetical protein